MNNFRVQDAILLLAFAGIAVVALLPGGAAKDAPEDEGEPAAAEKPAPSAPAVSSPAVERREPATPAPGATATDAAFPLTAGSKWVYYVAGPKELVPHDEWTMELRKAPADGAPGEMACGFGDAREIFPIWEEEGAIRFAGLPLATPLEGAEKTVPSVEGKLFPARRHLVEGATWEALQKRDVEHLMAGPGGRMERAAARSVQTDRALLGESAETAVPAGRFTARRIDWKSRIALSRAGRPILDPLTAEAFRTETMWLAEGVGIVRRRIEYTYPEKVVVTFDLRSRTVAAP